MTYVQDDFFYYLKIAQNLARGSGSTFNGLVSTNGYHPLWMFFLAILSWFTNKPQIIFGFIATSVVIATMTTYLLSRRLIIEIGADRLVASAVAAYLAVYSMPMFFYGMEVTLTIPLMLAFILCAQHTDWWQRGFLTSFSLGLIFSAMLLSRLDTALFAAIILVGVFLSKDFRASIHAKQWAGLIVGMLPIVLYLLSNRLLFHTWMPVSGMAKQLKISHQPTTVALASFFYKGTLEHLVPVFLAILALPFVYRSLNKAQQILYPATLLFPLIHIFMLSYLSDWPLWGWYFYAIRPAFCISAVVLLSLRPVLYVIQRREVAVLLMLFSCIKIATSRWDSERTQTAILQAAVDIEEFSATHPGIYAMGDRSGTPGYLLSSPLVQLEGLVMDRAFLDEIQNQTPLQDVLERYHVRFYVASTDKPYSQCFHAIEPAMAGPAAPHMRSDFCLEPVATFTHNHVETLVYDLQPNEKTQSQQR
jgi:hypothetical protein